MPYSFAGVRRALLTATAVGFLNVGVMEVPQAYQMQAYVDRAPEGATVRETIDVNVAGQSRKLLITRWDAFPAIASPSIESTATGERYSLFGSPEAVTELMSRPAGSEVTGLFRRYSTGQVLVIQSLDAAGSSPVSQTASGN